MKIAAIYTITNLINNKIYVGYSINSKARIASHKYNLKKGIHDNEYLQLAFNKYGIENFSFEILEECDEEFLCSQENYWCNLLNTHSRDFGYNLKCTHPNKSNHRLSESTKIKLKRKLPDTAYKNAIKFWKGKSQSSYNKMKSREYNKNRIYSEEEKLKRRIASKNRKNNGKTIKVEKYSLEGDLLYIYKNIRQAATSEDVCSAAITSSIARSGSCNGFIWKIIRENNLT